MLDIRLVIPCCHPSHDVGCRVLREDFGFERCTPTQATLLPDILGMRDIMVEAPKFYGQGLMLLVAMVLVERVSDRGGVEVQ